MKLGLPILGAALLLSCAGGLPPSLQRDIGAENARLQTAEHDIERLQDKVRQDVAQAPDLFAGTTEPAAWNSNFAAARQNLASAKSDAQELVRLSRTRGRDIETQARRLLQEERRLREAAENTSKSTEASAAKWLAFRHDLPSSLDGMNREYQAIRAADLMSVASAVARTEKDWPAKAPELDNRLAKLRAIPAQAESAWSAIEPARKDASAGKASGQQVATLIEADDVLAQQAKALTAGPAELQGQCNQLYDAWDLSLIHI